MTEDVSSSLWELVDRELATEGREGKQQLKDANNFFQLYLQVTEFQKRRLTQALSSLLASLVVAITLLAHQHPLQLLPLLLLSLTGKL